MGTTKINWSNVSVVRSHFKDSKVENVIARYERCMNVGRQKDPSYEIEHQFLVNDGNNHNGFTHRTYEVKVHPIPDPLFVQFTPTEIIVGTSLA